MFDSQAKIILETSQFDVYQFVFVVLLSSKVLLQGWLNGRNLFHVKAKRNSVPEGFDFELSEHQKAADYTVAKAKLSFASMAVDLGFLLWLLPGGGVNSLSLVVMDWFDSPILQGLSFFGLLTLISFVVDLPATLTSVFGIEESFGFNKMTPKLFIIDTIKSGLVGILIGAPLLALLLSFFNWFPEYWWLIGFFVVSSFQLLMMVIYPRFIAPLFNKFSTFEEGELKQRVEALLERIGFEANGLFVMNASVRSTHGNAYFTGLGKQKRIVFFDTLLKSLKAQEVEAVLAHELGHFKKRHILKMLVFGVLMSFVGFYCLGQLASSPTFYKAHFVDVMAPFTALFLFQLVVPIYLFFLKPLLSWYSRKNEFEADEFAAHHSSARDLKSALVKLVKDNASTLTPDPVYSKFYFSHPPIIERLAFLSKLQTKSSSGEDKDA